MLVVLEGLDGAGTTTQARRLCAALAGAGRRAHMTREPSDGPIGRMIREMLVGGHALGDGRAVSQETFSLLFAADRMDHVEREVAPAIARGEVVVSDRWYHSSLAYQGTGAARAWIRELNRGAMRPDVTIFLRVKASVAAERRLAAGRVQELFEGMEMQERVAEGYEVVMREMREAGERVEIVDGEEAMDVVTERIVGIVEGLAVTVAAP